jgi:hypothetical protein
MASRIECPYCGRRGFVRLEHVIKGSATVTLHYCGACNRTWQRAGEDVIAKVDAAD